MSARANLSSVALSPFWLSAPHMKLRALVARQRTTAPQRAEDRRMPHLGGGHVQGRQLVAEFFRIVDQWQQVRQRDELAVVETTTHEARVVVPALLAVGHDVDSRAHL